MTLQEIYNHLKAQGYESDKGTVHSYIEIYEELLRPYRSGKKNVLEIGLLSGASIRMWERYFDERANVYGIDCDLKPIGGRYDLQPMIEEGFNVVIGDAEDSEIIKKNYSGIKFDVIIEDANHSVEQQLKLYQNFKPYMADGGIYIIEDIQDIDSTIAIFENMEPEKQILIYDLRGNKGRYDDVLAVIK